MHLFSMGNKTVLTPSKSEVEFAIFLGTEHLDDLVVDVDSFGQHPTERRGQEVVSKDGHDTTRYLEGRGEKGE